MTTSPCLIRCGWIGYRFARRKSSPWIMLASSFLNLLFVSGVNRTHEQIRLVSAVIRIDFVKVYSLLNDLLW